MTLWNPANIPFSVIKTKDETLGTYTQQENVTATALRTVNTFEVLDYDSLGANYALIYKAIAIQHNQSQVYTRANEPYSGAVYIQYLYNNGNLPASALVLHNETDEFTATGTRTVTYKLHYKIGDAIFKVDLATCTITSDVSSYTLTGERLYGVSMQVSEKFITYAFEKHTANLTGPLGAGTGYPYDSPRNLEDWNVNQLGEPIWTRSKQVIGLINIADGVGSDIGYLKQEEYDILTANQFGVGIVDRR